MEPSEDDEMIAKDESDPQTRATRGKRQEARDKSDKRARDNSDNRQLNSY